MRKTILKNVAILAFAMFGLGIIGNNVMYAKDSLIEDPGDGGGGGEWYFPYTLHVTSGGLYCCKSGWNYCHKSFPKWPYCIQV